MYDPMTVAFEIRNLFKNKPSNIFPEGYRPTVATIWHVDPESDHTDDSCGYSTPKLTDRDWKIIDEIVNFSHDRQFFCSEGIRNMSFVENPEFNYKQLPPGECLALVASAWRMIAWRRDRRNITSKDWDIILGLAVNPADNLRSVLAPKERYEEKEVFRHFLHCVMRAYLRSRRKWYQHPRWHIHHWKIQIHCVQELQRWLFSRCAHCHKRFKYGYAPVSHQWDSDGPQWFNGERDVYHSECDAEMRAVNVQCGNLMRGYGQPTCNEDCGSGVCKCALPVKPDQEQP